MSLTALGFNRPRLNEIKTDYDQRIRDALGPVNVAADSVIGQLNAIFSAALDDAWEALQNTYDSMYPFSAEGTSLDGAVAFVGLERIGAAATTVVAMCYGTESTAVPDGSLARSLSNKQFVSVGDAVITRANAGDVSVKVSTVTNSANYQIIAGGVSVVYTADSATTANEIAAGLAALFNPDNFTATATGDTVRIVAADGASGFPITVDSKLAIVALGSPVTFTALDFGAIALPVGSLTRIDTSVLGWDGVDNLADGVIGRNVETDEELRKRHQTSVRATGAATLQAIRARLLAEVDAVTYVKVYENRTKDEDAYGLPPHSFECVVSGGLDTSVAAKIFEVKPAGIETHGTTSVDVMDDNGDAQPCKFSRPTTKYTWIRVSVDSLNLEEPLPDGTANAIADAVLAYGSSLSIAEDVLLQRFIGPIYNATSGIGSITVEAALTDSELDVPSYSVLNIAVGRQERADFNSNRITVVGV